MNIKKMVYISTVLTFLLCFLTHFLYDFFPNTFFSIFFPVNESIWEHMKMIYTTILLYGIVEYFLLSHYKIEKNNFLITLFLKAVFAIGIYLLLFLPIYYKIGENMPVTFLLLFLTLLIVNYIGSKLYTLREIKYQNIIAILGIILVYIIMGYLTYKPIKTHLFFDTQKEKYGINDYVIDSSS